MFFIMDKVFDLSLQAKITVAPFANRSLAVSLPIPADDPVIIIIFELISFEHFAYTAFNL